MINRKHILGALAAAMAISASSSAIAQCVGSGDAALLGAAPFNIAGIAQGAAVSSLVSSINTLNTAFLTQSTAFVGAPGNPRSMQEGGGIWVRGIGGEIDSKNTTTSTYNIGGSPVSGNISCGTETNLRFAGVQVGTDMATLNWNGWNIHIGSMAGYVGAKAKDTSSVGVLNPLGGTFENQLDVPFAGIYAAATYGGWFIDGQVRFDYYQNRLNDPVVNGLFNQNLDARGLSGTLNIGYNHQLGNGWFIEPSAGIIVSNVEVDPLNVAGTLILAGNSGFAPPGSLQIHDIRSTLGRLSVRTGTTIVSDRVIWQPFATASVYHEFEDSTRADYFTDPTTSAFLGIPTIGGALTTDRVGTYGQFALGVAGQLVGTGWLGYVRGDYRTGDRIDGYSLNGGLRYQFTPAGPALAPKGLITKAPALPVSTAYNWTGWYIGANFGAINGKTDLALPGGAVSTSPRYAGPAVGGQIGYDYQFGKWVVGLEGMGMWTDSNGSRPCPNGFFFNCEVSMKWLATGTARVGYALWDRSLVYLKGGVAAAEVEVRTVCNTDSQALIPGAFLVGCPAQSASDTRVGYTIGFGSEFALSENWTVKGETNFFDFGREEVTTSGGQTIVGGVFTPTVGGSTLDVKNHGFNAIVALNYRFSTGGWRY
ncbi:autotransporter outer membrane beta-barrel domain-containing protein [Bradyrhizobium sp. LHD-71]|uniref:autotransporter outer membrane beta-barrel domain-containing protein n=1 Tax=Bradyrhizobium sp. LHD-71 TaxID=3072141 RepID=UPI00280D092B|nr:autotransporter outer membrane beta-barrel domain-containing protein [Bradyrhizobium sp. LHD-71]MDQ8727118.1 autotransporter domain-containing protein [Bradyrhizobium sp. LHD-71]